MRFFLPLLGVFLALLAAAVGAAAAGEGIAAAGADPLSGVWRMILDYGATGAFIIYLIHLRNQDHQQRLDENKRKDKVDDRWIALDREIMTMAKDMTKVATEAAAAITEVRISLHDVNDEMRHICARLAADRRGAE